MRGETTLSVILIIIVTSFTTQSNGRLTELDKNDVDLDSLERHLEDELAEDFVPIPLKNMRQILVSSLEHLSQDVRQQARQYYETVLEEIPKPNAWSKMFPDKNVEKKKSLKLQLLDRGLWVECNWVNKMPPPFDQNDPCTEPELQYLLDNSE